MDIIKRLRHSATICSDEALIKRDMCFMLEKLGEEPTERNLDLLSWVVKFWNDKWDHFEKIHYYYRLDDEKFGEYLTEAAKKNKISFLSDNLNFLYTTGIMYKDIRCLSIAKRSMKREEIERSLSGSQIVFLTQNQRLIVTGWVEDFCIRNKIPFCILRTGQRCMEGLKFSLIIRSMVAALNREHLIDCKIKEDKWKEWIKSYESIKEMNETCQNWPEGFEACFEKYRCF